MRSAIYAILLSFSSYSVQNIIMMCQINAKFFSLSIAIALQRIGRPSHICTTTQLSVDSSDVTMVT